MAEVDVADVVQCKDCKYWESFPSSSFAPDRHECKLIRLHTVEGWFCASGERKDGDPEPLKEDMNMCGYKIFSKRLKGQLDKKGMTQRELAEKIGATEVSVSRYVSGQRIPKATVLLKIAMALGVSTDYLLGVEEKGADNAEGYT